MPRFLLGWLLGLGGNAIGLLLAWIILPSDQFEITSITGFIIAVIIFAILSALFTWIVLKFLVRHAGSIVALTGFFSTFFALLVTSLFVGGLDISGMGWFWGTLIVWVCGMFIWLIPGPWRSFKKDAKGA